MQTQSTALVAATATSATTATTEGEKVIIESRYGTIEIDPSTTIHLPNGLLGFPEWCNFALVDLGEPKFGEFGLLQSVSDNEISFIVLPIGPHNELIEFEDIENACTALDFKPEDLVVLLLVSIRKSGDEIRRTVNLRAPLLIDAAQFKGAQHVLANERYPIQFDLL